MNTVMQLKMDQLPPLRALRRFLEELAAFHNDAPPQERPQQPHILLEEVTNCQTAGPPRMLSTASTALCVESVPMVSMTWISVRASCQGCAEAVRTMLAPMMGKRRR